MEWTDQQWDEAIKLLQRNMLQGHIREELVKMQEGQLRQEDLQGLAELKEAVTSLEKVQVTAEGRREAEEMALRRIQTVFKQWKTVSLDEVRKELHKLVPAF